MHGSASAVRPPIPLEPPTSTTLSELNRTGGEGFGFLQTPYWDPQTNLQHLNARLVRLENVRAQLAESMDGFERARNATAAHERMMIAINGDQMLSGVPGGPLTAVGTAYHMMRERERLGPGASFTTVRPGPRGPEIMVVPPQATGGGPADDDDGVTLRGMRVRAQEALASGSRQNEPHQNQANAEQLQVVLTNIGGSLASLHGRQLPPPFVGADNETAPMLQHPPRDLPSPSATPPTVVRVSTPTTAESSHRADSTSPRPPYPPVQAYTIIERTPSPVPPLAYPLPLPNIRHVFDPTGPGLPTAAVPVSMNPAPIVSSRGVSPVTLAPHPTGAFVPPGVTDSALPTPRPFNRSPIRPARRAWRREDPNGDEVVSDEEDSAAQEHQRELRRRSRLMSRSTTNVNDPYDALALIARLDGENQGGPRRDESNDQEKHGTDELGDALMAGSSAGSVGNSRPGSRGSSRSFNMNFTGAGEGEVPLFPCPLPILPSEMVSKPYRPARDWKTRFTPPPPLYGSVARARAAAHAKGSRRPARRYNDPVGR
ncbi:hypothetical protein FRC00_004975 [Tulasnella sp. 408]|nr:hypothetical protein FRC00_004975 [Tulasnella sp. 408]